MRIGPTEKFWIVLDVTPGCEHGDYLLRVSLSDFKFLFVGGLTMARNSPAPAVDGIVWTIVN